MPNLFEIIEDLQNEDNYIDFETGEVDTEYLDSLSLSFNQKAENIIKFIKDLDSDVEALKKQEDSFKKRRQALENKANGLKKYLASAMQMLNQDKLEFTCGVAKFKTNPPSVKIVNDIEFIEWAKQNAVDLLRMTAEINKTALKERLKSGEEIHYATLIQDKSLCIK